jgi:hypothetical protein
MMRTLLLAASLCLLATSVQAQLIVGTDDSPVNTIYHIDVNTLVATSIYAGPFESWGMAYDGVTNTLYWNNGATLYSSPYDINGLNPVELGDMTFNGAPRTFTGLTFRDGSLLGTPNTATEAVYEINPTTLVATQLWVYPSGDYDFGGLGVDVTSGLLYGVSDDSTPLGRGLYEIDTVGQTATLRASYPAGETDIDGLAAHNGLAYLVIDQPGDFYVVDIATGMVVGTIPSPWTTSEVFSAAAFITAGPTSVEPTTWGHIKGIYK